MDFINELEQSKIIAIMRGLTVEQGRLAAEALYNGGIRFVEVTMNTERWADMLKEWRPLFEGRMRVGAGTVLNLNMAKEAYAAGAQFLVTPNTDLEVIEFALAKQLPIISGALTPTEIVAAWEAGATAVKLFPMASLGLSYFKEIRAPLNHIRIVPTGGVNLGNISEFIKAGAFGLGMGNSLVDKNAIAEGRYTDLTAAAEAFVHAIRSAT